jgi:hypothetical protein
VALHGTASLETKYFIVTLPPLPVLSFLVASHYLYSKHVKSNACLFWVPIWLHATWVVRQLLSLPRVRPVGLAELRIVTLKLLNPTGLAQGGEYLYDSSRLVTNHF